MNQTLFTLQLDMISSCFDIKINDLPLHTERKGRATSIEFPINHLLIRGINQVSSFISPAKHETQYQKHTKTDIEVFKRDIKDLRVNRQSIQRIIYPDYKNDPALLEIELSASCEFEVLETFLPIWHSCPLLSMDNYLIAESLRLYKEYFNALKNKDFNTILQLTELKDHDFANSYFSSLKDRQTEIISYLLEVFEDDSFILIDFDIQQKIPSLHGFGKLLTFINEDNRSPLQYYNEQTGMTTSYPIFLGKINGQMKIVL
jgi:hypothetical protein